MERITRGETLGYVEFPRSSVALIGLRWFSLSGAATKREAHCQHRGYDRTRTIERNRGMGEHPRGDRPPAPGNCGTPGVSAQATLVCRKIPRDEVSSNCGLDSVKCSVECFIKRIAFLMGLIPDPVEKHKDPGLDVVLDVEKEAKR